jgi:ribosomal protein S18 acetylase RimI-like enzyme
MEFEIVHFKPEYSHAFKSLNLEWIEKYFVPEKIDLKVLNDPENEILKKPGFILFAIHEELILGTGAIVSEDEHWELTKMAVSNKHQSQGVGYRLAIELITLVKNYSPTTIKIVTNTVLTKAVNLYKKIGFKEIQDKNNMKYVRGNIFFELKI